MYTNLSISQFFNFSISQFLNYFNFCQATKKFGVEWTKLLPRYEIEEKLDAAANRSGDESKYRARHAHRSNRFFIVSNLLFLFAALLDVVAECSRFDKEDSELDRFFDSFVCGGYILCCVFGLVGAVKEARSEEKYLESPDVVCVLLICCADDILGIPLLPLRCAPWAAHIATDGNLDADGLTSLPQEEERFVLELLIGIFYLVSSIFSASSGCRYRESQGETNSRMCCCSEDAPSDLAWTMGDLFFVIGSIQEILFTVFERVMGYSV